VKKRDFSRLGLVFIPLSNDETIELYPRRTEPDVQKRYLSSVVLIIKKRLKGVRREFLEERFQTGLIGAWEALRTWDPSRGPWFPYASRGIAQAIAQEFWMEMGQRRGMPPSSYREARFGRLKGTVPEAHRHFAEGDEPSVYIEPELDPPEKLVEMVCDLSSYFRKQSTPRLKDYIWRVIINDEPSESLAKKHKVTRQALHLQWQKFRKEIKALCQGVNG
jgi:hypothetical protein